MKKLLTTLCSLFRTATKQERTLLEVSKEFLDNEIRENNLTKSTSQKYDKFYRNLENFLRSQKNEDLILSQVNPASMIQFKTWLHKSLKSCCLTHSAKHIEMTKRILDYATDSGYIKFNPIASVITKRDRAKEKVYLEQYEINKLERAQFAAKEYHLVRDLYLFQCYTGLSYIDLWAYKVEKYTVNVNGSEVTIDLVTGKRGKTGNNYWTELSKPARYIHEKYKGEFPPIDNGRYNRFLKELMLHVGINKYIVTHTGRKTFATTKHKNGYSTPAIAGMLGNTEQVARTHYIDYGKENIVNEIIQKKAIKPVN